MSGIYCKKHEEYSHTGVCRWCPTVADKAAEPDAVHPSYSHPHPNFYTPLLPAAPSSASPHPMADDPAAKLTSSKYGECACGHFLLAAGYPYTSLDGARHASAACSR